MSQYAIAWTVYACAAAGGLLVLWRLLGLLRLRVLRWPVLVFVAGLVGTPVIMQEEPLWYAPALLDIGFRMMEPVHEPLRQLLAGPLVMASMLLGAWAVIAAVIWLVRRSLRKKQSLATG